MAFESIYTKKELNTITRKNNFEYRLARNIACKYTKVWAVAWSSEDENGKRIAIGVNATTFSDYEEYELKSFILFYKKLGIEVSFAKCYENLPITSWT